MQIKFNLKKIRMEKQISQNELAKLANVSIGTIVRMEQKQIQGVSFITILKISKVLNISIYEIFDFIDL